MRVIIVDWDGDAIRQFKQECEEIPYVELCGEFQEGEKALEYVASHRVEAVFLNVENDGMDGIHVGEKLRELCPDIVMVFVTEHPEYTLEALRIKADYYVIKPYTPEHLRWVMENVRLLARRHKKQVYIRTFGRFDLFVNGQRVRFTNKKAKELLALCVDHKGGHVSMEEAIDKLWENRLYDGRVKNLYRKAAMDLKNTFESRGIHDVFWKKRGICWIDYEKVECDYFIWSEHVTASALGERKEMLPHTLGEYMPEYFWAEPTNAHINNLKIGGGGYN